MEALRDRLSATPLSELLAEERASPEDEVVSLCHNDSVEQALKVLARAHILSAPVVVNPGLEDIENLDGPAETAAALVGWLDVKDIIQSFLAFLHTHKPQLPTNMLALMTELEKQGPAFSQKMLITIVGSEDRGLVYQTDAEVSVLAAIRDMFLGQPDGGRLVHRLAIFDAHGSITRVVSQMDVLRLLRQHLSELGPCAEQSLQELGLYKPDMASEVVTLQPNTPTLLAYAQLAKEGLTGAPVVSAEGELIANLSFSDIRGIQPDHFGVLALPVAEFLAVKHDTAYLGYSQFSASAAHHPFFACGPPSTGRRPATADAADADAAAAAGGAAAAANGAEAAAGGSGGGGGGADAAMSGGGVASPGGGAKSGGLARTGSLQQHKKGGSGSSQQQQRHGSGRRPSSEVGLRLITCAPEATLGTVLCQMCDNHVHRLYVTRESDKPGGQTVIGVVTPTDCLNLIAGQAGWLRRTLSLRSNGNGKRTAAAEEALEAAAEVAGAVAAAAVATGDAEMAAADGEAAGAGAAAATAAAGVDGDGSSHKKAKV